MFFYYFHFLGLFGVDLGLFWDALRCCGARLGSYGLLWAVLGSVIAIGLFNLVRQYAYR